MANLELKLSSSTEEKLIDKIVELAQYMGETTFYPYQLPFAKRMIKSIISNEGATLTALFARQCIAEGSFIMDRDGKVLRIENHPDAWKTKDSAEMYEIRAVGGYVGHYTAEHPIATDKGWVNADQIKKYDKIIVLDKWDKFGDGNVEYDDKVFVFDDDLAELVGWLTANIQTEETIKVTKGYRRVAELITKYFPETPMNEWEFSTEITIVGVLKNFLKQVVRYDRYGIPSAINYFTKEQLIRFFYPIFLTRGKSYRSISTVKFIIKDKTRERLFFYREHLNKLGLRGNLEFWIGHNLGFTCTTNYDRFKELFGEYLPSEYFPPVFNYRTLEKETFLGKDGEELTYAQVHTVKKYQGNVPVWDITVPGKGWFLTSGIKCSNSGKSTCVAMVTAACMVTLPTLAEKFPEALGVFAKGFWVGCFGPIGEQAVTIFDKIHDVLTTDNSKRLLLEELKIAIPARGGARGNVIKLQNKSLCRYQSGSPRAKVESKTYHLMLLDECQGLENFSIKKGILPSGAAVNATVVATGTPDVFIGYFYDMIEQNKIHDLKSKADNKLHFEADYTVAQKHNPFYKKYIEGEIKKQGHDSNEFMMAYRLIWPITKGMLFTKSQLEDNCYNKSLRFVLEYRDSSCVAGIDFGKAQDSTVVVVVKPFWDETDDNGNMPKQVLNWMEIEGDAWEDQYVKIVEFLSNYTIETLVCDSTGVGDPIQERLAILLPNMNVVPFVFTPKSKDRGYKYLIQEIENKRVTLPAHNTSRKSIRFKKLENQLISMKKSYTGRFLTPQPVSKERGGDDAVDALMLAIYGTYFEIMPEIEETYNDFFSFSRNTSEEFFGRVYSRPRK